MFVADESFQEANSSFFFFFFLFLFVCFSSEHNVFTIVYPGQNMYNFILRCIYNFIYMINLHELNFAEFQ